MTPEERERMNSLCAQILDEQDNKRLSELVAELSSLLEQVEDRLRSERQDRKVG